MKHMDMTGRKYGRLSVIKEAGNDSKGRYKWLCRCECGASRIVDGGNLRAGVTKSCGCYRNDRIRSTRTTHGMSHTPEHNTWIGIKQRCQEKNNKSNKYHGDKGIRMCDEWLRSFEAFYNHVGDRPTKNHQIDRIDNTKGYEPGNVRWATCRVNAQNRSTSKLWFVKGKKYGSHTDAARDNGVSPVTIINWCKEHKYGSYSEIRYKDNG